MPQASLSVLGAFALQFDGQLVTSFPTDKARALLAYLALEAERLHAREQLAALLWPKIAGESALTNLRKTLHRLRETLDAAAPGVSDILLVSTRQTIQLNAERLVVDSVDFERLLTSCTSHPHPSLHHCDECLARLEQAAELYRGELLAGLGLADAPAFEEWLLLRREALHQQLLGALSTLAAAHEARGEYERAHTYATRQLNEDPYREEAHRQVMRLLTQRGLAHQALAQYATCKRLLAAELGVEPEAATTALYEQIRAGAFPARESARQAKAIGWQATSEPAGWATNATAIENHILTSSALHPLTSAPLHDWGEMPAVDSFQGREAELATLERWMVPERCRLVVVLGMGGAGKTALAAQVVRRIADEFDIVIWRSLLNAPPLAELLRGWLRVIARQTAHTLPASLDEQLRLLLDALRRQRCLLVLDNAESILQAGAQAGVARPGYEDYGQLIQRAGASEHSSCVLLTSREQPQALARLAGHTTAVRLLPLPGLDVQAGHAILQLHGLAASGQEAAALVAHYSGNPLALQIVANTIVDLFAGSVDAFRQEEAFVFDDIRQVLDEQFARLSDLEREILIWLAIEREAVPAPTLRGDLVQPDSPRVLLEALQGLQKRSLLEKSADGFTLQNVVMEYTTAVFVSQICREIAEAGSAADSGAASLLAALEGMNRHALLKAQAKEYVRQSQVRLILQPIAEHLVARWGKPALIERLRGMLARLRAESPRMPGYAAGNSLNVLLHLNVDMTGFDFSQLSVWQADLRGATLPAVSFAHADLQGSVFTDAFQSVNAIAFHPTSELLATSTTNGEIHLWRVSDWQPISILSAHTGGTDSIAFSPDGRHLASGSWDQTIRVWDVSTGQSLHTLRGHTHNVKGVSFSPDGRHLASGSWDQTIRVWDVSTGKSLYTLRGHTHMVESVAFSPDGSRLASGAWDHTIQVWDLGTGHILHTLRGHTNVVRSVAFSPDGSRLASGAWDHTIQVWDLGTGHILHTLRGHTRPVACVAFSPDGTLLASGGDETGIRMWSTHAQYALQLICGQDAASGPFAFSPDGRLVASGAPDQTVRIWNVHTGENIYALHGYDNRVKAMATTQDGRALVSAGRGGRIHIWDVQAGKISYVLRSQTYEIEAVAFSPDGALLACGGADQIVHLWDLHTRRIVAILQGHADRLNTLAFSPDGTTLASGGNDQTVRLWNLHTQRVTAVLQGHTGFIQSVAFSPDGTRLASAGNDQTIRIWDSITGQLLQSLAGHTNIVRSVSFSPDGGRLASGSWDQTVQVWDLHCQQATHILSGHTADIGAVAFSPDGRWLASSGADLTIRVWDISTGRIHHILHGHQDKVVSVAFSPDGATLASASADETLRLWAMQTGTCTKILRAEGPYTRMNIAGVTGITEAQQVALKALGAVEM